MKIEVQELTPANDVEVEAFLDDLSRRTIAVLAYHYPFYRDALTEMGIGTPRYLAARLKTELVGLLPVFVRETEVGSAYCSLPFFGPNAGVLCAEDSLSSSVHFELINHLLMQARAVQALSCAVYTPFLAADFSPYEAFRPDAVVEKFTQCNPIDNAEWNGFIRNRLRRAERLGVTVSTENTPARFDEFYSIYSENCRDYGIPLKPRACLEKLLAPEVLNRRSRLYYAVQNDALIGALLLVHSPATVSYYVPCTRHDARNLQPGTLLVDRAFQDMREAGARVWNWESSPNRESGVYEYKRKWGAEEKGYRIYVWCCRGVEALRRIENEQLARSFPYFYLYPFDRLRASLAG
jgi:hypothetical protein